MNEITMKKSWQKGVLAANGEFLTFDDANLGHMACLRNWNDDGPWLFTLGANGDWVSYRRANDRDCAALGVPDWMRVPAGDDIRCKQCDQPHDRWDMEYCLDCIEARMGSFSNG